MAATTEQRLRHCLSCFGPATEWTLMKLMSKHVAPATVSKVLWRMRKNGDVEQAGEVKSPWGRRTVAWKLRSRSSTNREN